MLKTVLKSKIAGLQLANLLAAMLVVRTKKRCLKGHWTLV